MGSPAGASPRGAARSFGFAGTRVRIIALGGIRRLSPGGGPLGPRIFAPAPGWEPAVRQSRTRDGKRGENSERLLLWASAFLVVKGPLVPSVCQRDDARRGMGRRPGLRSAGGPNPIAAGLCAAVSPGQALAHVPSRAGSVLRFDRSVRATLLELDDRNFQVRRSGVSWTRLRRNRSLHVAFNAGVFELGLATAEKMRFILVGGQEPDRVLELLRRFDPAIEVTGKPNPLPCPKKLSSGQTRILFAVLAGLLLTFAAVFGYCAVAGVGGGQGLWPVVAVNVLSSGWCLLRAWRIPGSSTKPPNSDQVARTG